MALTVLETTEQQLLPCQQHQAVEQQVGAAGGEGAKAAAAAGAEKAAAMLKETDHGGDDGVDDRPERDDIWNMIQAQKPAPPRQAHAPYVHPLVRRSSSLLTQKSLEICTESLGSETGSDGFSDADRSCPGSDDERERGGNGEREEEAVVAPPPPAPTRAFPPPLPSLARRKVESTMEMRQERQDGRLLVKVVPVAASSTLLRAQRRGGRLLLSFADTAAPPATASDELVDTSRALPDTEQQQQADEEDEEEDEVEVVDRGTVVEVKVSAQPPARSGSGSGPRVHRSALVINKFVGAEPVTSCDIDDPAVAAKPPRRATGSTTTAVAALAAASALSATAAPPDNGDDAVPGATCGENKLLQMTAKRHSSKEELMKHMRRCSGQLSPSLFVWEGCIATST